MVSVLKDSFAKEGGHYYKPDGTPAYTITGANGKERNTTLRDARKLGLLPSVTTILKMAAAPGLERWKIGNAILSALTLPRSEGESDESYIDRIVRDSEEQARKARDKGTAIHGSVEKLFRYGRLDIDDPHADFAVAARKVITEWAGEIEWEAERSFASELGYGGKLDLMARIGYGWLADVKTTDKPLEGLKTWPEHRRQLAAYGRGTGLVRAPAAIVYVNTIRPEARLIELDQEELEQGWHEFQALLALWKAANKVN